ncbi:MAG: phosphatidate cytidylyltransferase [Paracoccaceae bacterium]
MSDSSGKWEDLGTRVVTAIGLIVSIGGAVAMGGVVLMLSVALIAGIMIWELVRMQAPDQPFAGWVLGGLAGLALLSPLLNIQIYLGAVLMVGLGFIWLQQGKVVFALYSAVILTGCFSLFFTRNFYWPQAAWLVSIVVVTDIAGYAVGRMLGGPKFWPRFSPKKTWSGTIGGWVGAALVGLVFAPVLGTWVVVYSVFLAFASQMGDIAESAIKRRAGVKDSSDLLPGHGGLLDRFDGMIAAFAAWIILLTVLEKINGAA